jgi:hypothetical protein
MLLTDDTRGEESSFCSPATPALDRSRAGGDAQLLSVQKIASSDFHESMEMSELRERLESMDQERVRCSNELQKLMDMIGFAAASDSKYRDRESYLPGSGAMYDKVKEIQALVRGRYACKNSKGVCYHAIQYSKELDVM